MSASFVFESNSEADTDRFGAALARALPPGAVIALVGTLGAGKTRLVQAVGKAVGLDPHEVVSPTFVLVHEYNVPQSIGKQSQGHQTPDHQTPTSSIYHFDAYRIKDNDEFLALGPDEYFADERAWSFIEWADRVGACLPLEHLRVNIEVTAPDRRRFALASVGTSYEGLVHFSGSLFQTLNLEP
jgi:tRNA threonylcarbamoyladenosine biosynthesis protein TsaE